MALAISFVGGAKKRTFIVVKDRDQNVVAVSIERLHELDEWGNKLVLFRTTVGAHRFMKSWTPSPYWRLPVDSYKIIRVKRVFKKVRVGWRLEQ